MARRPSSKVVRRALQRAAADSFFLASALEAYRSLNGLDDGGLIGYLGCSREDLTRLAFCRRPATDAMTFREEVEQIAAYGLVRAETLGELLREVESLEALQAAGGGVTSSGRGLLMAARDRADEEKRDSAKHAGKKRRRRKDRSQGKGS